MWTPYEQFYDALESKIDEDSDRPIEVKWDEMMKNLDVKIEKANHAKLKGTEFFKMGNLAQVGVEYFVLKANLTLKVCKCYFFLKIFLLL